MGKIPRAPRLPAPTRNVGAGLFCRMETLYRVGLANGTKARTIYYLATRQHCRGIVTAGGRLSTQGLTAAAVAAYLGVPFQWHCPTGPDTPTMAAIWDLGGTIVQHRPGHRSVCNARARVAAANAGHLFVPAWMECPEHVAIVVACAGLSRPRRWTRLVMPVGSGMALSGVLWACRHAGIMPPVLGVTLGADPTPRLRRWAPPDWSRWVSLVPAQGDYGDTGVNQWRGIPVDPVYSARCIPFLEPGDCLWNAGARGITLEALYGKSDTTG